MWPFKRRPAPVEHREQVGAGNYTDQVLRLAEAQASGTAANVASTAAMETAAGALSRMFAAVEVQADDYAKRAITPATHGVDRSFTRCATVKACTLSTPPGATWCCCPPLPGTGKTASMMPAPALGECAQRGTARQRSTTKVLPFDGVVFLTWGSSPGTPYAGTGPASWAYYTARMQSELERSIGDEASGPIAQLLVATG